MNSTSILTRMLRRVHFSKLCSQETIPELLWHVTNADEYIISQLVMVNILLEPYDESNVIHPLIVALFVEARHNRTTIHRAVTPLMQRVNADWT